MTREDQPTTPTTNNSRRQRPGTTPLHPLPSTLPGSGSSLGGDGHAVLKPLHDGDDIDYLVGLHRFHLAQLHERVPEDSKGSGKENRYHQQTRSTDAINGHDQRTLSPLL